MKTAKKLLPIKEIRRITMKRYFYFLMFMFFLVFSNAYGADVTDLTGYTGKIGQEDINYGTGQSTDTFSIPTYDGSTTTLTKVPDPNTDEYSQIKGVWYVSDSDTIVDHSAASGADYDAGNLKKVIDVVGSDDATIELPGDHVYPLLSDLTIPSNICIRFQKGAILQITDTKKLTFNGPFSAGLYQVFDDENTGNDGVAFGAGVVSEVYPEWWGAVADSNTDCSIAIQSAINSALDIPVYFSGNYYNVNRTIYIDDSPLISNGGRIYLDSDDWTENGTATAKNVAAMITKSSANAGYGLSTVKVRISGLHITINRSSGSVYTTLFMDNISEGYIKDATIDANGTRPIYPLDVYRNVQNFVVDNCIIDMTNHSTTGGIWVRNYSTTSPTRNISIINSTIYSSYSEEPIAIFTPSNTASIVEDITVSNTKIYISGTDRLHGVSVHTSFAGAEVRNVRFSNTTITSTSYITSSLFKVDPTAGTVSNVSLVDSTLDLYIDTTSYTVDVVKAVTEARNVNVIVRDDKVSNNSIRVFYDCDKVISCATDFISLSHSGVNTNFASSCNLVSNCINAYGSVSSCSRVVNSHIYGRDYLCTTVIGNTFTLDRNHGEPIVLGTGDLSIVKDNVIIETWVAPSSGDRVFYTPTGSGALILENNYYLGARRTVATTMLNVVSYKNNLLDNGSTIIGQGIMEDGYSTATISTSGTGEDNLHTCVLPPSFLGGKGRLKVSASGTKSGSAGNKTIKLYFGASSWTVLAAINTTTDWYLDVEIYNTNAASQRIRWKLIDGSTVYQGYETASIDTSASITVKLTGECANSGDNISSTIWSVSMM